jgi:glycosyltransferase involved in cell wall biosynthesis
MRASLFRVLAQEHWASIDVYADRLIDGLRRLSPPDWSFDSLRPGGISAQRLRALALYVNRTALYMPYARRHQGDINHVLDNSYGHLLHTIDPRRTVVTSHGGTPIAWRQWNPEGPSMRFFDWAFAGTLKAARIIIVSEYAKRELTGHYAYDPDRIHVVWHGIDKAYARLADDVRDETRRHYLRPAESGLILHVGLCVKRKNLDGLLKAFALLLKGSTRAYRLLQVGGQFSPEQQRLIEQLGIAEHVTQLPPIPNRQLVALYNAADVFAFPSLYEGFGVPLIEAMACGTPVVCTEHELFREICDNTALFVDSRDAHDLASTMARVLDNPDLADDLGRRGLERARLFTWGRCARETLAVYKQLCAELRL